VMVDAVQIGTDRDSTLTSIVRATGGFCFAPESIAECVNICELETLLCRHERVPPETFSPISASWDLQMVPGRNTFDSCDGGAAPPRREDPNLKLPVQSLPTAIRRNAKVMDDTKGNKSTHDRNRRLMIEMKRLEQTPHPAFDVYPSESDIGFWKLVVEGASSTPYHEGGWLLSIHFPTDFPESPPEVRFETPILHMNVSRYGKICFSLLDRNWSSDTTIREVLDGIYGLLLNPDHADPLNTTLALSYHNADGTYQAKILEHVRIHASISRAKWKARIETGDNSTSASSSSGTVPHEDSADDS
jgi:ubiquitin-protein ligase